jgi:excisionase family DNA binding protein
MKTFFMKPSSGVPSAPRETAVTNQAPPQPAVRVTARRNSVKPLHNEDEIDTDSKKRVRLKPESREQLLERLRNPQLSLHEASILLRVSRATVRRYADSSRLPCQRTPGGQRRFFLRDIEVFYRQLKMKK